MAWHLHEITRGSQKYTLHVRLHGHAGGPHDATGADFGDFIIEVAKNATAQECVAAIQALHDAEYPDAYQTWVLRNEIAILLNPPPPPP